MHNMNEKLCVICGREGHGLFRHEDEPESGRQSSEETADVYKFKLFNQLFPFPSINELKR